MHCHYIEPGYNGHVHGLPADRWEALKKDAERLCVEWERIYEEVRTMPASLFDDKSAHHLREYCEVFSRSLHDKEDLTVTFDKEDEHGVGRVVLYCSGGNQEEKVIARQAFIRILVRKAHERGHNVNVFSA